MSGYDSVALKAGDLHLYETNSNGTNYIILKGPNSLDNDTTTITLPSSTGTIATIGGSETLTNKTLTSPVLTTPQINDTSADHQYVFAVSELAADRTVTLPLLGGNDEFVFKDHTQTLTNKTLTSPSITGTGTIAGGTISANTAFVPVTAGSASLGSSSLEFSDLYLADSGVIYLGNGQDVTLTHFANTGILLNSSRQFQFGDSGTYIHQYADGILTLVSDGSMRTDMASALGLEITNTDAANNAVLSVLTLKHETSHGTPVAGIGAAIDFTVETADGNNETGMTLQAVTTDVTGSGEDFDFVVKLMEGGAASAERMRLTSAGNLLPGSNDGGSLGTGGTSALGWSDLYLATGGVINFKGSSSDVTLTGINNTAIRLSGTHLLQFGDADNSINQNGDGKLNLAADTAVRFATPYLEVGNGTANQGVIRLLEDGDNGTAYVGLQAPADVGDTSTIYTLPAGSTITNGYVLSTNGSGTLSWVSNSGGGASGIDGLDDALLNSTDSKNNLSLGHDGTSIQAGALRNTFVGITAGDAVTTGDDNTFIGNDSGTACTISSQNTCVGSLSGATFIDSSVNLTAVGYKAGNAVTSGANNTFVGHECGDAVTTGSGNTFLGKDAGSALTSGASNTALGHNVLGAETVGKYTVAVGSQLFGSQNNTYTSVTNTSHGSGHTIQSGTRVGHVIKIASADSASDDDYIGKIIKITDGGGSGIFIYGYITDNVQSTKLVTFTELDGTTITSLTSKTYVISTGYQAGNEISNIGMGYYSGTSVTTGFQNIIVGSDTATSLTTGYRNTILGSKSCIGSGAISTGVNNTVIGYGAKTSSATVSNEVTLGDSLITSLRCADTTIASLSDARDKTDVIDSPYGLDFIDSLRPVQYTWQRRVLEPSDENHPKNGVKRVGFLAQDFQAAMPNNENEILDLVYDVNPERIEAKYGNLIPVLTQAIKDLKAQNDALSARVAALESA